jgi:hypothetical protein
LRDATSWDEVVTGLGYEHLKRRGLRHTGLTWIADAGVPLHTLRKIAGHADLGTTQRYLHPDRQSVADAGKLLFGHLWSQNGPKLHIVRFDSECVVAGQSIFSSVGLTGFEPATT